MSLAMHYEHTPPQNFIEATKWWRKAAEQGNPYARLQLGIVLSHGGHGLKKNFAEAMKWWRMEADKNSKAAQRCLGDAYLNGQDGVSQDYAEAYFWYKLAGAGPRSKELRRAERQLSGEHREGVDKRIDEWLRKHATGRKKGE